MAEITNEPGRCGFDVVIDATGFHTSGWNHDPEALDCCVRRWV